MRKDEFSIIGVYIIDSAQIAKVELIKDLHLFISLWVHSSFVESNWIFPGSREAQVGLEIEPSASPCYSRCRNQSNKEPLEQSADNRY